MSLTLHDAAAKKIKQIAEEDPAVKDYHKLRVFIQGGGCSGFQYGFMFDKEKDDDLRVENGDVTVVIDPLSLQYLDSAEIDFQQIIFRHSLLFIIQTCKLLAVAVVLLQFNT